jgi:hypothetical protein
MKVGDYEIYLRNPFASLKLKYLDYSIFFSKLNDKARHTKCLSKKSLLKRIAPGPYGK